MNRNLSSISSPLFPIIVKFENQLLVLKKMTSQILDSNEFSNPIYAMLCSVSLLEYNVMKEFN